MVTDPCWMGSRRTWVAEVLLERCPVSHITLVSSVIRFLRLPVQKAFASSTATLCLEFREGVSIRRFLGFGFFFFFFSSSTKDHKLEAGRTTKQQVSPKQHLFSTTLFMIQGKRSVFHCLWKSLVPTGNFSKVAPTLGT